ncbi:DUF554 domain-containing protein [Petroclostridium sp. X23]|uniref:DUF554 domain-containing protein n=1 Tax=Petroclostridium sp. X23 TaxID=3045146 RepID=UPI0024AE5FFC|nr:DUF554 domain-containing protein [Petroclostridium sp. X23]WHH57546.1 DUF554 domain-containing protein [Petroclostridium sp. X23]
MLGTVVNAAAIVTGGLIGATVGGVINEKYKSTVMQGISLSVIVIGLSMALEGLGVSRPDGFRGEMLLLMIFSLVIGGIIGEWLDIEAKLDMFGKWIQKVVHRGGKVSTFAEGFVIASLVYCVGSMAIMGSIQDGLNHDPSILYAKSVLDGVSAVIFASTLGVGVMFSFIPVFLYQGAITLLASFVEPLLMDWVVAAMSGVGGILIIGIGMTMLDLKRIKVGNLLPAIFIPMIYGMIVVAV